ncbi:S-adenosyl-L-methionine-dependent methyltransferase [Nemania serpens]|nr:S-adenosyl-L-methionine-dependent methyltransferase [Nemania serpens]
MPRLPPSLFRRAAAMSPHLATLLPACRTVASARSELRWIREHVLASASRSGDASRSCGSGTGFGFRTRTRTRPPSPPPSPLRGEETSARRGRRGERVLGQGSRLRSGERMKTKTKTKKRTRARAKAKTWMKSVPEPDAREDRVARLVARRGAGEPLQYVLGTQPFADLEMECERGVLIPRAETEAWASTLADLLLSSPSSYSSPRSYSAFDPRLRGGGGRGGDVDVDVDNGEVEGEFRILDFCSGTGCIALSLYARIIASMTRQRGDTDTDTDTNKPKTDAGPNIRVLGLDIEPRAVRLARRNLARNFPRSHDKDQDHDSAVSFHQADIFTSTWLSHLDPADNTHRDQDQKQDQKRKIDLLVSNPPYISHHGFARATSRSVRNHEPKLALVPFPSSLSASSASSSSSSSSSSFSSASTDPEQEGKGEKKRSRAPEDVFYARLLDVADALRPRVAAFEVGDMGQAVRVVEMAMATDGAGPRSGGRRGDAVGEEGEGNEQGVGRRWDIVEIWRDWPDSRPAEGEGEEDVVLICGREVPVRGSGHGRVVFLAESQRLMMRNRVANRGFRRVVYAG